MVDNMKIGLNIYSFERNSNVSSQDIISYMRQSLLGIFYLKYLKRFQIIKGMVQWLWRKLFPVYLRYAMKISLEQPYPIVPFALKLDHSPESVTHFFEPEKLRQIPPCVYPVSERHIVETSNERPYFPEVSLTIFSNALVSGGTNFIVSDDKVFCHDLFDFSKDYTSEELHGRACIFPRRNRIRLKKNENVFESFPLLASFLDACAGNYSHWMTEVLPRINLFCSEDSFRDIPIVVNAGMHENIMESLYTIVGPDRRVVTLSIGLSLRVDRLFAVSATGYIPFDWRTQRGKNHSHGVFSPSSITSLVTKIKSEIKSIKNDYPTKIVIRRNSGTRLVVNAQEIEDKLVALGFSVVEPEKMTFREQVLLFSHVDIVVGATGAAFANLLFCKPSAHIVILFSKHKSMPYWYWQNMASSVDCRVNYVFGNIVRGKAMGIHGDFYVQWGNVLEAIEHIEI